MNEIKDTTTQNVRKPLTETCSNCGGSGLVRCYDCEHGYKVNSWGDQVMCDCDEHFKRECRHCAGTGEVELESAPQQQDQPRDPSDVNALPADLHDYERMTVEELREVALQLPYYAMRGIISADEKDRRATIVVAVRNVKVSERNIADAQRLLDKYRARLAGLLAASASNDGEVRE